MATPSFNKIAKRLFKFYPHPELADALARDFEALVSRYEAKIPL